MSTRETACTPSEARQAKGGDAARDAEEPDFYMENGLLVFTAAFHRRRGYCCESGCRHCPYRES